MTGAGDLATTLINLAFKDLSGPKSGYRYVSAVYFFESGYNMSLFCALAEMDELEVYNAYRRIMNKPKVDTLPASWKENGEVGIYKGDRLITVAKTVKAACEITGVSSPTLYKYAKSGIPMSNGYKIVKNIQRAGGCGCHPSMVIEIIGPKGIQTVIGLKEAERASKIEAKMITKLLRSGFWYRGYHFKRKTTYKKRNTNGDK
jgi:hypothetical protein